MNLVCAHFRYTTQPENNLAVAQLIVNQWQPVKYLFCAEVSKQGVPHIHAHLEFQDKEPTNFTRSTTYKKLPPPLEGQSKKYFEKVRTTKEQNLIYVYKCRNVILTNLTNSELEILDDEEERIEEDKATDIKVKLCREVECRLPSFIVKRKLQDPANLADIYETQELRITLNDIARIVREVYVKKYKKLPPTKGLMFQYKVFIADTLNICSDEVALAYDD